MALPRPGDLVIHVPANPRPAGLAARAGRRGRVSGFFLKGPVPLAWLASAAALRGRALAVGVLVWFMVGIKRATVVAIPGSWLAEFGVNRFAFYRGLAALERRGLVKVERRRGSMPRITLVDGDRDRLQQGHHANRGPAEGVQDDTQR